jgi:hypothetical protein
MSMNQLDRLLSVLKCGYWRGVGRYGVRGRWGRYMYTVIETPDNIVVDLCESAYDIMIKHCMRSVMHYLSTAME